MYKFNPFTGKLDIVAIASSASVTPQSGAGSPEGSISARFNGDMYINATTGVLYINPTSGATSGREIVQTMAST